ncbi:MAG: MoaD/ThiS family protein [Ignavibacteriales bacterium]
MVDRAIVRVRYYGRIRLVAGVDVEDIPLTRDSATLLTVVDEIVRKYGEDLRSELERGYTVTVCRQVDGSKTYIPARLNTVIHSGDEIVFVYPFTGG